MKKSEELEETIKNVCHNIRGLIRRAKLKESIEVLHSLSKELFHNKRLERIADYYMMQLNRVKSSYQLGLRTQDEYDESLNKITIVVLDVVQTIESGKIFDLTLNSIPKIESLESEKKSHISLPDKFVPNYKQKLKNEINIIRIFGMSEPISLQSLYVRVHILQKLSREIRWTKEELEQRLNQDTRTFSDVRKTISGERVVNSYKKFILLGKPGGGKTTFLKYIALLYLNESKKLKRKLLPIFIPLKDYSESDEKLLSYISKKFQGYNYVDIIKFLEHQLELGNIVFLFDGLDEVKEIHQEKTISEILTLSNYYDECQYIISCRIAAYNHWFSRFVDVELADFKDNQIERFIKNWFWKESNVGKECWTKLTSSTPLRELANSPLLLTLLCIAYDELYDFPPNRGELYEEAIEALLKKWDASRRIRRDEVYEKLTTRRKETLLSKVAYETFVHGDYFFHLKTLEKLVGDFINDLKGFEDDEIGADINAIIHSVEQQHGIWIKRVKGNIYSFSHLTFQEYFTAKYIVENRDENTLDRLIENHIYEDRWREVFLLTGVMLERGDAFILKMLRQIDLILLPNKKLNIFIKNIHEVLNEEHRANPKLKLIVINTVLSRCTQTTNGISENEINSYLFSDNILELTKSQRKFESIIDMYDKSITEAFKHIFGDKFEDKFFENLSDKFHTTKKLSDYLIKPQNREIVVEFNKYAHVFELIIACINHGTFLSQKTKLEVMDKLLKPLKSKGFFSRVFKK